MSKNKIKRVVQEQINQITNPDYYVGLEGVFAYKDYALSAKSDSCVVRSVLNDMLIDKEMYKQNEQLMKERGRQIGDRFILFQTDKGSWERVDLGFVGDSFRLGIENKEDGLILIDTTTAAFSAFEPKASTGLEETEVLSKDEFAVVGDIVDFIINGEENSGVIKNIDFEKDEITILDNQKSYVVNIDSIIGLHKERVELNCLNFLLENNFDYCPDIQPDATPNLSLKNSLELMKSSCDLIDGKYFIKKEFQENSDIKSLDDKILKLIIIELKLNPQFFGSSKDEVVPYVTYYWLHDTFDNAKMSMTGISLELNGIGYSYNIAQISDDEYVVLEKNEGSARTYSFTVILKDNKIIPKKPYYNETLSIICNAIRGKGLIKISNKIGQEIAEEMMSAFTNFIKIILN